MEGRETFLKSLFVKSPLATTRWQGEGTIMNESVSCGYRFLERIYN